MKNKEKYIDDIISTAINDGIMAITEKGISACVDTRCDECLARKIRKENNIESCGEAIKHWCEQEYIPFEIDDLIEVRRSDGTISIAKCIAIRSNMVTVDLNFNPSNDSKIRYISISKCKKHAGTL